jgi:uncharacterized protein (TIGR04255 family)
MQTEPHYSKSPIVEAVIEFRVELPAASGLGTLQRCFRPIKRLYPIKREVSVGSAVVSFGKNQSVSASNKPIGYVFVTSDKKQVFQARRDCFAFSRLAPYDTWDTFRDEARRLWSIFRRTAKPTQVSRVGLRYINRLDLPLPLNDFRDYIRTVPEVAPGLPQGLAGFFMQLNIPHEDIRCTLLLNQMMIEPPTPEVVSVVLDIDLFCGTDVPSDDDELWNFCEQMRSRKNKIFQACITDRTEELIK